MASPDTALETRMRRGRCTHRGIITIHFFFFFNDTATTEIYTLSLHDALPISTWAHGKHTIQFGFRGRREQNNVRENQQAQGSHEWDPAYTPNWDASSFGPLPETGDRKSTRLNSSHLVISYAVFCLKKKKL